MTGCICWIVFVLLTRFRSAYLSFPQEEVSSNMFEHRNHRPPQTIITTDGLTTTTQLTLPTSKQTTLGTGTPSSTSDRFTLSDTSAPSSTSDRFTVSDIGAPSSTSDRFTIADTGAPSSTSDRFTESDTGAPSSTSDRFTESDTGARSSTSDRFTESDTGAPSRTSDRFTESDTGAPSITSDRFTVADTGAPSSTSERFTLSTDATKVITQTGSQTNTSILSSVLTKSTYLPTLTTVHIPKYNWSMAMLFNISINRTFEKELNDPTSKTYKHYENEFSITLRNVFSALREFEGILINGFRNGSIQCAFYLQLNGVSNLTTLEDEFNNCIDNLKTATVDGVSIDVDENAIKAEYLRAVNAQITGSNCDNCQIGYACSFVYGVSSCRHICELVADVCSNRGGCLYDPLKNQPTCRCSEGLIYSESRGDCGFRSVSHDTNYAAILGGSIGGSLGALAIVFVVIKIVHGNITSEDDKPSCLFNLNICSHNTTNKLEEPRKVDKNQFDSLMNHGTLELNNTTTGSNKAIISGCRSDVTYSLRSYNAIHGDSSFS